MYRNELKYILDMQTAHVINGRLQKICRFDENTDPQGFYRVTSLYFDDYANSALNDNLIGQMMRKKYRIRIYNGKEDFIRLERKTKHNQVGMKESVVITREQCDLILKRDYESLMSSTSPLLRAFCMEGMGRRLVPKVIVDYDRKTFVYDPGFVRITMDYNVKYAIGSPDLFAENPIFVPTTNHNQVILEVKYTGFLPGHIKDMVQQSASTRQSVSKYTLCRASALI